MNPDSSSPKMCLSQVFLLRCIPLLNQRKTLVSCSSLLFFSHSATFPSENLRCFYLQNIFILITFYHFYFCQATNNSHLYYNNSFLTGHPASTLASLKTMLAIAARRSKIATPLLKLTCGQNYPPKYLPPIIHEVLRDLSLTLSLSAFLTLLQLHCLFAIP